MYIGIWSQLNKYSWPLEFAAAAAKSLQLCPTLSDPVRQPTRLLCPGILQARTLEWVAISFSNAWKWKVKVKSRSRVRHLATPWTAAYQSPPSMGFSRQEYWSGVPLPPPRNTWSNRQIWPWSTKWSRAKANRVLPRERTVIANTLFQQHRRRLYTRWSIIKLDWLYSLQPKIEKLYRVSKNKTRSCLWLRSWIPYCKIHLNWRK